MPGVIKEIRQKCTHFFKTAIQEVSSTETDTYKHLRLTFDYHYHEQKDEKLLLFVRFVGTYLYDDQYLILSNDKSAEREFFVGNSYKWDKKKATAKFWKERRTLDLRHPNFVQQLAFLLRPYFANPNNHFSYLLLGPTIGSPKPSLSYLAWPLAQARYAKKFHEAFDLAMRDCRCTFDYVANYDGWSNHVENILQRIECRKLIQTCKRRIRYHDYRLPDINAEESFFEFDFSLTDIQHLIKKWESGQLRRTPEKLVLKSDGRRRPSGQELWNLLNRSFELSAIFTCQDSVPSGPSYHLFALLRRPDGALLKVIYRQMFDDMILEIGQKTNVCTDYTQKCIDQVHDYAK